MYELLDYFCSQNLTEILKLKLLEAFSEWVYFSLGKKENRDRILKNSCLNLVLE